MSSSARLEIHQLNVSAGDAALIIVRDLDQVKASIEETLDTGTLPALPANPIDYVPFAIYHKIDLTTTVKAALLVDGGVDQYGGDVLMYMARHGVIDLGIETQDTLTILLSHYHDDHQGGLRYMLRERVEPKKKGDKLTFKQGIFPKVAYLPAEDAKPDKQTLGPNGRQLRDWLTKGQAKGLTELKWVHQGGLDKPGQKGNPIVINLAKGVNDLPVTVTLLAANQGVYNKDTKTVTTINPAKAGTYNQNDRCAVAVLEYGSFRYFLGGDIGGNSGPAGGNTATLAAPSKNWYSPKYADIESSVGRALEAFFPATPKKQGSSKAPKDTAKFVSPGYCTVMKSDHHGSNTSNDVFLFGTIRPLLLVNSSGIKLNSHGHPTQQVIDRANKAKWGLRVPLGTSKAPPPVDNTIGRVYITEVAKKTPKRPSCADLGDARVMGCIVVRPEDESVARVQAATAFGTELFVHVYGNNVFTYIAPEEKAKYKLVEATGDIADEDYEYYPLGPWWHYDVH